MMTTPTSSSSPLPPLPAAEESKGFKGRLKLKRDSDITETSHSSQSLYSNSSVTNIKVGGNSWMDLQREQLIAYEYLCHIGEAKQWMEACIGEEIAPPEVLQEELRNGIILAKLAKFINPSSTKKIFMNTNRLSFRHSDNINYFFNAIKTIQLPEIFWFELTDLYDKKNIPKVIYCIHALSHFMSKKGIAPKIQNLVGKLQFTEEQMKETQQSLDDAGVAMPVFTSVETVLAQELNEDPLEVYRERFAENPEPLIKLQSLVRMRPIRKEYTTFLAEIKSHEEAYAKVQAAWKGGRVRKQHRERKSLLDSKSKDIAKIQALWRGRSVRQALLIGSAYDVSQLHKLTEILHEGEDEIQEEFDEDALRRQVIRLIRENSSLEEALAELDIKISLLVKNRISLEDVVKLNSKSMRLALQENEASSRQSYDLKGSDKESHRKRELYGQFFYLLQTRPTYIANLMYLLNKQSGSSATKFFERIVLTLYGYAQNTREEFLLLNLIKECISIETHDMEKLDDFWKGNPFFIKIVLYYTRSAKERDFLRTLFQPIVMDMLNDRELDLDVDPNAIYRALIRAEESSTGEKSKTRSYEADLSIVLQDLEVIKIRTDRLSKLKKISSQLIQAIKKSVDKMPFGIRWISKQLKDAILQKFPGEDVEADKVVINLLYYRYMNPVIVAPELFDVIVNRDISPVQRRNLAEVAKMLQQVSTKNWQVTDIFLIEQLGDFAEEGGKAFMSFAKNCMQVPTAEDYFGMNEFVDLSRKNKLNILISTEEIYQIHQRLESKAKELFDKDDVIQPILIDLGPAPIVSAEFVGSHEITLPLINRYAKMEETDPAYEAKKRYARVKRMVTIVLRVQQGENLMDLLESATTEREEKIYANVLDAENKVIEIKKSIASLQLKEENGSVSPLQTSPTSTLDKHSTFAAFKKATLEAVAALEETGQVKRQIKYQDLLNAVGEDLANLSRIREARRREIQSLRTTLRNLEEKSAYLQGSRQSYTNYLQSCMSKLQNNKVKRVPRLFSRQYYHYRDIKKAGESLPKFGSVKYTAAELYKKGVLLSIDDYNPKQFQQISLTIKSNEPGVFIIEGSFLGITMEEHEEIKLDDLLAYQYNNVPTIKLFDSAKVSVNLLIFLINKKFFG